MSGCHSSREKVGRLKIMAMAVNADDFNIKDI
jgi:hypothetical protein